MGSHIPTLKENLSPPFFTKATKPFINNALHIFKHYWHELCYIKECAKFTLFVWPSPKSRRSNSGLSLFQGKGRIRVMQFVNKEVGHENESGVRNEPYSIPPDISFRYARFGEYRTDIQLCGAGVVSPRERRPHTVPLGTLSGACPPEGIEVPADFRSTGLPSERRLELASRKRFDVF
jgi:hypothetical protein